MDPKDLPSGGPAFPGEKNERFGQPNDCNEGMTLRDYFAAKALPVVASGCHLSGQDFLHPDQYASAAFDAYRMADAMIKARAS